MIIYNKLVRDKIPDIIVADGKQCEVRILDELAYEQALRKKLREELEEYEHGVDTRELADLLEVIYALAAQKGINPEVLESLRIRKREERGGFEQRLWLVKVLESADEI